MYSRLTSGVCHPDLRELVRVKDPDGLVSTCYRVAHDSLISLLSGTGVTLNVLEFDGTRTKQSPRTSQSGRNRTPKHRKRRIPISVISRGRIDDTKEIRRIRRNPSFPFHTLHIPHKSFQCDRSVRTRFLARL